MKPRRIVCAANKFSTGEVFLGVRHCDKHMNQWLLVCTPHGNWTGAIQGFVDNKGAFLTREEAWKVAVAANQLIPLSENPSRIDGILYSEDLH